MTRRGSLLPDALLSVIITVTVVFLIGLFYTVADRFPESLKAHSVRMEERLLTLFREEISCPPCEVSHEQP